MDKEKLEEMIIDYIDNELDVHDRDVIERELTTNAEAYALYTQLKEMLRVMDNTAVAEPAKDLSAGFDKVLREELSAVKPGKTAWFKPSFYRAAAAVTLLVVGGGIGYLINESNTRRIQAMEAQVNSLMQMMHNNVSASQRLQGVNVAMTMEKADDEIIDVLVTMMNEDPNSNVRLAALDALARFVDEPHVRKHIIDALSKQTDPVVQIALIQLLVKIREKEVVNDLRKIVDDEETIQAVKDEAYSGIMKLS